MGQTTVLGRTAQSGPRRLYRGRPLTIFIAFVFVALATVYYLIPTSIVQKSLGFPKVDSDVQNGGIVLAETGQIRRCTAPRLNSWSGLTEAEVSQIISVISKEREELGVSDDAKLYATILSSDWRLINSYSAFAERLMPNKTSVLSSLTGNGDVEKWARVVMVQQKQWGGKMGGISEWMVSEVANYHAT
jgi:hypothetical protein